MSLSDHTFTDLLDHIQVCESMASNEGRADAAEAYGYCRRMIAKRLELDAAEIALTAGDLEIITRYRDVDVRVILDDDKFDGWFGRSLARGAGHSKKWSALMAAISLGGKKAPGLPTNSKARRGTKTSDSVWKSPRR